MCLNCGCGIPNDDMGNPDNLTLKTLAKAAKASQTSGTQTLDNLKQALNQVSPSQLEEEVKKLG